MFTAAAQSMLDNRCFNGSVTVALQAPSVEVGEVGAEVAVGKFVAGGCGVGCSLVGGCSLVVAIFSSRLKSRLVELVV